MTGGQPPTPAGGLRAPADTPRGLRRRPFVTLALSVALGVSGWTPLLSFLSLFVRDELHAGLAGAAWLNLAMHAASGSVGLGSGLWIRRAGSRWTYALGLSGMTAFAVAMAVTPSVGWLIGIAPLAGLALALHWTGLQAYALEAVPPDRRGVASGLVSFIGVVAPGLAGLGQGFVAQAVGFGGLALVASAFLGAALLVNVLYLPRLDGAAASTRPPITLGAYARLVRDGPPSRRCWSRAQRQLWRLAPCWCWRAQNSWPPVATCARWAC